MDQDLKKDQNINNYNSTHLLNLVNIIYKSTDCKQIVFPEIRKVEKNISFFCNMFLFGEESFHEEVLYSDVVYPFYYIFLMK